MHSMSYCIPMLLYCCSYRKMKLLVPCNCRKGMPHPSRYSALSIHRGHISLQISRKMVRYGISIVSAKFELNYTIVTVVLCVLSC